MEILGIVSLGMVVVVWDDTGYPASWPYINPLLTYYQPRWLSHITCSDINM